MANGIQVAISPEIFKDEIVKTNLKLLPKVITKEVIPDVKARLSQNQECVAAFGGSKGLGKSSAALAIQLEYDPAFSLEQQVTYDFDEIRTRIASLPAGKGHHIDELRFTRMAFRTTEGDALKNLFKETRIFRLFSTWSTPDLLDVLPIFLRQAHYYVQFFGLGYAVILQRNDFILRGSPFGILEKELDKVVDEHTFERYFIKPAKRAGTFVEMVEFPRFTDRLTPEWYAGYNAYRLKKTREAFERMEQDAEEKRPASAKAEKLKAIFNEHYPRWVSENPGATDGDYIELFWPGSRKSFSNFKKEYNLSGVNF